MYFTFERISHVTEQHRESQQTKQGNGNEITRRQYKISWESPYLPPSPAARLIRVKRETDASRKPLAQCDYSRLEENKEEGINGHDSAPFASSPEENKKHQDS